MRIRSFGKAQESPNRTARDFLDRMGVGGRRTAGVHEIVVKPNDLKSSSKDRAGISLSSPEIRTRERAIKKPASQYTASKPFRVCIIASVQDRFIVLGYWS